MWGGQTNVNILVCPLVGLNKALHEHTMQVQPVVGDPWGLCSTGPQPIQGPHTCPVWPTCMLTPSKRISDRVRTSSGGPPCSPVVLFLLLGPLLRQPPLLSLVLVSPFQDSHSLLPLFRWLVHPILAIRCESRVALVQPPFPFHEPQPSCCTSHICRLSSVIVSLLGGGLEATSE